MLFLTGEFWIKVSCVGLTHNLQANQSVNQTSVSDPDPVGSVSFGRIRIRSGNVDLDPGTKEKSW